jgi:hypothetical protein
MESREANQGIIGSIGMPAVRVPGLFFAPVWENPWEIQTYVRILSNNCSEYYLKPLFMPRE